MILIIVAAGLVLGIAFYQALQGLFSSLVMAILTILCAALAVNFYEPVAAALLYSRQPAYADAVALTALFVLPLLALRLVIDKLIAGNVVVGQWADRIGGGLLGVITGILHVGILMLALQMLPFGPNILDYEPFDESLQREDRLVPFYPDEFTIGLGRVLSAGSLSGQRKFAEAHDSLLLELYCARNRPEKVRRGGRRRREQVRGRGGRFDAFPGYLAVSAAYECPPGRVKRWCRTKLEPLLLAGALDHERDYEPGGGKIVVIRVQVHEDAREDGTVPAIRNWWMLPATQFRLVSESGKSFFPVGYLTYVPKDGEVARIEARRLGKNAKPQDWLFIAPERGEAGEYLFARLTVERQWTTQKRALTADWVFRVPATEVPAYMVFRRVARAQVPAVVTGDEAAEALFSKGFAKTALGRKVRR